MIEKESIVLLRNRGKVERGIVTKTWRRKDIYYHNVHLERGIDLEAVTTLPGKECYIDYELSMKLARNA